MTIAAPAGRVWEAITDPALVKQWLFGTEMEVSAWEAGGQIRYRGQWEGKGYEDKGEIIEVVPQQRLVTTYWSAMSGTEDVPENYQKVTYELAAEGEGTRLAITQEGAMTEEGRQHMEGNWSQVLTSMKQLLENGQA